MKEEFVVPEPYVIVCGPEARVVARYHHGRTCRFGISGSTPGTGCARVFGCGFRITVEVKVGEDALGVPQWHHPETDHQLQRAVESMGSHLAMTDNRWVDPGVGSLDASYAGSMEPY